jgi:Protein of unknown function (DUF2786)
MSRAQHILAVIVGLITGVLLMESYGAMVDAARAGGRAIPELWPLGTEALALAMEVSVLEAKRLGHRAVLRLSWLLLVASVALSTLLQVAVAPSTLVGYLTAGATPVWLLGSFAVLSLLYRTPASTLATDQATDDAQSPTGEPRKRERARAAYAALVAAGQPVTGARLAEAAGVSASYGRALLADFQADPTLAGAQANGQRPGVEVGGAVTATIWRTCPSCFGSFEQPDDPGRKRVYCSRACQQAAYRARQRASAGQRHSSGQQRTGRQDWRSESHSQRRQRASSDRPGASQRQHRRQDERDQQHQRRWPPPGSANGHRPGATGGDELARIRRIIAALLRKAAATAYPHEAAACREKAEALRAKYGL